MKSQTPQDVINKCFYEQSIKVIKLIFENSEKNELDIDELEEEFKNFWESNNKIKVNPEKQKRKTKELNEEEKCIAAKKDGQRCNGKRFIKGENPMLCSLHNNNGMNFGTFYNPNKLEENKTKKEKTKKEKISSNKESNTLITCNHIFLRGNRKNEKCGNLTLQGKNKCKLHNLHETTKLDILSEEEQVDNDNDNEKETLSNEEQVYSEEEQVYGDEEYEENF